jgi:hypothetical protein
VPKKTDEPVDQEKAFKAFLKDLKEFLKGYGYKVIKIKD